MGRLGEEPLLAADRERRADEPGRVEAPLGDAGRPVPQRRTAGGRLEPDAVRGPARHHDDVAVARGGATPVAEHVAALHLADVDRLLGLLDRLVDDGHTVIVIEHHQAVMAHADWIIDLGPGAGHDGGRIVFEGRPAELVEQAETLTARHLREYVGVPVA